MNGQTSRQRLTQAAQGLLARRFLLSLRVVLANVRSQKLLRLNPRVPRRHILAQLVFWSRQAVSQLVCRPALRNQQQQLGPDESSQAVLVLIQVLTLAYLALDDVSLVRQLWHLSR